MFLINKTNAYFKLIAIVFLCILTNELFAQDESITYTTSEEESKEWKNYKYFDNSYYEQKTLFKVNFNNYNGSARRRGSGLNISSFGVEHKVLPQLSVELEGMYFAPHSTPGIGSFQRSWIMPGIRYYPSKKASAKQGNYTANNFTGSYFRANYQHQFQREKNPFADGYGSNINLSYGWQQKVGKFGQLDLAAQVSYNTELQTISLGNRISGGFGYGKSKTIKAPFTEEKYDIKETLWASPIFFVGNPNILLREEGLSLGVDLAAEFHMKNYWTIRPSIQGEYSNFRLIFNQPSETRRSIYFNYDFNIEVRKYLGIRKQIAKGKNTLAFSGPYLAFEIANIYERVELVSALVSTDDRNGFFLDPQIGFGWQHKVGSRFLFDVNWKLGHTYQRIQSTAELKIGILLKK